MAKANKARRTKAPVRRAYEPEPNVIDDADTANTARYDDVYYEQRTGAITGVTTRTSQSFDFLGQGAAGLRIEVWTDDLFRLRLSAGEPGPDFSYARDPDVRPRDTEVEFSEEADHYLLQTATTRLAVARADGAVTISDRASGTVFHQYATPFLARTTLMQGLNHLRIQLTAGRQEAFYGLGDKAWDTDLRGRHFENWCTDSFAYGRERDVLYRAIPFYYGLRDGHAYGLFLDNTYRTHFDFDSYGDGQTTIWADGGEFDYYVMNGPGLDDVARHYTRLTGRPELPPLWGLGFHQCRWSYYPEDRVRELADRFRTERIPCDAIYLDIDYMDGYRCFTWNRDYFPQPAQMIGDLREQGFRTVVMIDPGIRVDEDYGVYRAGAQEQIFCKRSTGEQMRGPVWPPVCVWPDYTDPRARDWWGPLYRELYCEQGVAGFWNDMNEPAMFKVNAMTFPDDVRHDFDGLGGDHKKSHNIYGMQMTRASYEGLRDLQPAQRPFLLGRATYSGGQRFAALWTGDNIASWEHLAIANRQCLRLAISGFSFVGTDIGGFVDDPDPELLTRWLQLAVFHPLMRIHSMGNNTDGAAEAEADEVKKAEQEDRQDQEPWVHGEPHTSRNRLAIELRYRLLPYLYTAFANHAETGDPVLRNLFFLDQRDPQCRKFGDQFVFGRDLIVCPVVKPGAKTLAAYLPAGDYYDFWTGKPQAAGKFSVRLKPDRLPIYVRAGAVLPTVEPVQHTDELLRSEELHLSIFLADGSGDGEFFWDAGDGYGYQLEQYLRRRYRTTFDGRRATIVQESQGQFRSSFRRANLRFVGFNHPPSRVTVDGQALTGGLQYEQRAVVVTVPFDFQTVTVE